MVAFTAREIEGVRLLTILHVNRIIGRARLPRVGDMPLFGWSIWTPERTAERRHSYRSEGLCGECGGTCAPGKLTCGPCRSKAVTANASVRARRLAEGLCSRCGKGPPKEGRKACQTCIDKESARTLRKYHARKS